MVLQGTQELGASPLADKSLAETLTFQLGSDKARSAQARFLIAPV